MSCGCPVSILTGPTLPVVCNAGGIAFYALLSSLLRRQCDLTDPCNRPSSRKHIDDSYDFIVIGGGSAGATIASRLSEEGSFSVLLIEAGGDEPTGTQVPAFFVNYWGSEIDWKYYTESESEACLNMIDRRCYWPRGKVLGGTSTINGMMYVRGSPKDYDHWAELGNEGWAYKDVLPFFIKSEDNQVEGLDEGYHGVGGPLSVTQFSERPPIIQAIIEAGAELGYKNVDINGKSPTGFALSQVTAKDGSRMSTSRAFLRPAKDRPNLHFSLRSVVTKIIFNEKKRAIGVRFLRKGIMRTVRAKKEVILSAGAVSSPQILLNSGVGPRAELESIGLRVIHDLPGVGKNLQNHVAFSLTFTINEPDGKTLTDQAVQEYIRHRTGPMSATGLSQVAAMVNSKYSDPAGDHPDIQLIFSGYLAHCADGLTTYLRNSTRRSVTIYPTLLRPKSRGHVFLRSKIPFVKPKIHAKYLTHPDDVRVLIDGIKLVLKFAEARAFVPYDLKFDRTPVQNCEKIEFATDDYWECAMRHSTGPGYHESGTCKMGPKTDLFSVVDNRLRVHGLRGIRIADTSIMPKIISGNTNAPAIMFGERAAAFAKQDHLEHFE